MATTDTSINELIINKLSLEQFNQIENPSETEIYLIPDVEDTTYARDVQVVHLEGTETIIGDKTFTGKVVLQAGNCTTPALDDTSYTVCNTAFVQNLISNVQKDINSSIENNYEAIIENTAEIENLNDKVAELENTIEEQKNKIDELTSLYEELKTKIEEMSGD